MGQPRPQDGLQMLIRHERAQEFSDIEPVDEVIFQRKPSEQVRKKLQGGGHGIVPGRDCGARNVSLKQAAPPRVDLLNELTRGLEDSDDWRCQDEEFIIVFPFGEYLFDRGT